MRTTKLITISLSPELLGLVDRLAREENRTRSAIFREAFQEYAAQKHRMDQAGKEQKNRKSPN